MNTKREKRASLSISKETKVLLDSIKHQGQSCDGVIQELIKFWKEKKGEVRRREQRGTAKRG